MLEFGDWYRECWFCERCGDASVFYRRWARDLTLFDFTAMAIGIAMTQRAQR